MSLFKDPLEVSSFVHWNSGTSSSVEGYGNLHPSLTCTPLSPLSPWGVVRKVLADQDFVSSRSCAPVQTPSTPQPKPISGPSCTSSPTPRVTRHRHGGKEVRMGSLTKGRTRFCVCSTDDTVTDTVVTLLSPPLLNLRAVNPLPIFMYVLWSGIDKIPDNMKKNIKN